MKPFTIIYEDNHLLVVNKSAGILVQGDSSGDAPLVDLCKDYIGKKYDKPGAVFLGVVHRLDRPVSGIVVLARTSKALERMNRLFREKETDKTYVAVVRNKPPRDEGSLVHWLVKDEKKNKTTAFSRDTTNALRSELAYQVIGQIRHGWVLQVKPLTGRPHQIRVQLASIGCSILGDVKYGDIEANSNGSIYLHARHLSFVHPVRKERLSFTAPFPEFEHWNEVKFAI
jgi:23S rRNA pseudouridine1911/1915/1917 synthase